MTLHEYAAIEQGTDAWLELRRGMVTASTVGKLITNRVLGALDYACPSCGAMVQQSCLSKAKTASAPTPIKTVHAERTSFAAQSAVSVIEPASNDESRGLTALLVAERITGWSDPNYVSADMMRGHDIEPIARDWYAERYAPVAETGFLVEDKWGYSIGFSPDGLVADNGLIEVKAPRAKTHLMTHLSGEMPAYHIAQVQAGLLVSDREWCDFISFYAGMPPFIKRVHRDEKWGEAIVNAVELFESKAAEMQSEYVQATTGIPTTERLLIDMEMVI